MVNIQPPLSPSFEGCFAADGYTHDAQCVVYRGVDPDYVDREICFALNGQVGDTITLAENPAKEAIAGFEDVKPMVFAGIFPVDTEDFEELRDSMAKLQLNDASLVFEPESSAALGFGFRCGFLGMLHLEIIQERLFFLYSA